jgi:ABC-type branched-subunit amino acid transport system substrate-binding protein
LPCRLFAVPAAFLRAADNQKLELPLFAGDALADSMMVALLKDQPTALKNLSVTTVNKGKNPFIRRFRAAFPSVMYGSFAAQGYDAMVALLRAYAAAPPPRDGVALAQELQQLEFEGGRPCYCDPGSCHVCSMCLIV